MSRRAEALAGRFEAAHAGFVTFVGGLTEAQWLTVCPGEERTVAALAHHVAWGYAVEIAAFQAMAAGAPVDTWTRESLDGVNAAHAEEFATCDKDDTLALLRANASMATTAVRSLSDEQLAMGGRYTQGGSLRSVERWVEMVLIGHIETHLRSMREAVEGVE